MKVRRGHKEDLPALIGLVEKFWSEKKYADAGVPFNPRGAAATLLRLLDGAGVVVVADEGGPVGYSVAALSPHPFNPAVLLVSELSIYAPNPKVHKLLDAKTKQVGKQLGATAVCSAELVIRSI